MVWWLWLLFLLWAASQEILSVEVCDEVRLIPVCSATEASLEILDKATMHSKLSRKWTAKTLIRLRRQAVWYVSLLFVYGINRCFSRSGSIDVWPVGKCLSFIVYDHIRTRCWHSFGKIRWNQRDNLTSNSYISASHLIILHCYISISYNPSIIHYVCLLFSHKILTTFEVCARLENFEKESRKRC